MARFFVPLLLFRIKREVYVFQKVKFGKEIILLEDKTDHTVADPGQLLISHFTTSSPPRRYSPVVGTSRAPIIFIRVDFPLPEFSLQ